MQRVIHSSFGPITLSPDLKFGVLTDDPVFVAAYMTIYTHCETWLMNPSHHNQHLAKLKQWLDTVRTDLLLRDAVLRSNCTLYNLMLLKQVAVPLRNYILAKTKATEYERQRARVQRAELKQSFTIIARALLTVSLTLHSKYTPSQIKKKGERVLTHLRNLH